MVDRLGLVIGSLLNGVGETLKKCADRRASPPRFTKPLDNTDKADKNAQSGQNGHGGVEFYGGWSCVPIINIFPKVKW